MGPEVILAWVAAMTEAGFLVERLARLGQRIQAGEDVTIEDIEAARADTKAAVARWDAAGGLRQAQPAPSLSRGEHDQADDVPCSTGIPPM